MNHERLPDNIPYLEFSTPHKDGAEVVVSAGDFPADLPEDSTADIPHEWKTRKVGNMSSIYETRPGEAHENLVYFMERSGYNPADVVIMKPQMNNEQPLGVINADQVPRGDAYERSTDTATMMYSYKPDRVLSVLTGDSPFMVGRGVDKEGRYVKFLIHLGWRVEESGYVQQALEYARDQLGLDLTKTYFEITPGAEKLDFSGDGQSDDRFQNPGWKHKNPGYQDIPNMRPVPEEEAPLDKQRFRVSMVGFALDLLTREDEGFGIQSNQIFVHGSDTTDKSNPYSSDRKAKASNGEIPIGRDAIFVADRDYRERRAEERGLTLGKKAVQS